MHLRSVLRIALFSTAGASLLCAQAPADSGRPPRGSQFLIPLGSILIPGLGQYIHKAPGTGLAYTGLAVGGIALAGDGKVSGGTDVLHETSDQRKDIGLQLYTNAAWLSSWDAFHRAVPKLRSQGKYDFLPARESVPRLISAPFDYRFLRRWTTWVGFANTAVVTALVYSDRESGVEHFNLRAHDIGYGASLAGNAATGEEAWFRGYLLPVVYENTGRRFWLANSTQAAIFSAGHLPQSAAEFGYRGAWGLWQGWLVRHDDWSVREAVFNHFWYDFAVVTAAALADEKPASVRIGFPTIRF